MRDFLIKIPSKWLMFFIVSITVMLAFITAGLFSQLFNANQLATNTDLISATYEVMGTIYAILITFVLWGVWQNYTAANNAAQNESYSLLDLVHILEASTELKKTNIRKAALTYSNHVIREEWNTINTRHHSHPSCTALLEVVQSISPSNQKETVLFDQTLTLLSSWLDARRTRLLIAQGNSAKALWPLLLTGAFVLFAFHGLFSAIAIKLWVILLFGFSFVIGLAFYLIFALDYPFGGNLGIDAEPFRLVINVLSEQKASS